MVDIFYFTMQQLETFFSIVECSSLSNAAKERFVSQPSLSKTLSRFEESIGITLFNRGSGALVLTKEGEFLYSRLKSGYKIMVQAIEEAKELENDKRKTLRIGIHPSCERSVEFSSIWGVIDSYERAHPEVAMVEEFLEYQELYSAFRSGELDAIISYGFELDDMADIETRSLQKLNFYIAMSAEDPLAKNEKLDLKELTDKPFFFVAPDKTKVDRERCVQRLRNIHIESNNIIIMPNSRSAARSVVRGKGYLFTCHRHGYSQDEMKLFPAQGQNGTSYLVCAWHKNDSRRELKEFINSFPECGEG
ncbi:MAG: LysR family transcriptional regulator [Clostridiales bacterium]|nr:LysR family transcriptional regulator [Clostridiales bacterium]